MGTLRLISVIMRNRIRIYYIQILENSFGQWENIWGGEDTVSLMDAKKVLGEYILYNRCVWNTGMTIEEENIEEIVLQLTIDKRG